MTRIYLVRHAEAEGNLYRIAHGHYNGLITARGYKQIAVLQQRLAHIPIDAVYSSDLFRTRTTATAAYLPRHLPLHTDPNLREVNMGVWEGHTWQSLRMEDEARIVDFNRHLDRWQVPGGETARQVLDRFLPALTKIAKENDGKTVAVFSHGAALRMVLGTLEGYPLSELGSTPTGTIRPSPCWSMTRTVLPCCTGTTITI
ncbi:MAG: histidine phosphatase family protein [Oscillospiraceae bacterium]